MQFFTFIHAFLLYADAKFFMLVDVRHTPKIKLPMMGLLFIEMAPDVLGKDKSDGWSKANGLASSPFYKDAPKY